MKKDRKDDPLIPRSMGETVVAGKTRIFEILSRQARFTDEGKQHEYTILRAPDWVNVVPVTTDGKVILIEQYRHGSSTITLEIPGGEVDPGETPEQCAARELEEETGFRAGKLEFLGRIHPNPAFLTNTCHSFLATECGKVGEAALDETEVIRVLLENMERIPALIADGHIDHALVVVAFAHMSLKKPDLLRL